MLKKTFLVVFGYLCLPAWHYIPAFLRYNQHWRCSQQTNKTIFSPFFASVQVQRRTTTTTENFFLQVFVFTSLQSNLSLLSSDIFFFQIFFRLLHPTKPLSLPNTIDVKRIYNLIFFFVVVKKTPKYRSTYVNGFSYN